MADRAVQGLPELGRESAVRRLCRLLLLASAVSRHRFVPPVRVSRPPQHRRALPALLAGHPHLRPRLDHRPASGQPCQLALILPGAAPPRAQPIDRPLRGQPRDASRPRSWLERQRAAAVEPRDDPNVCPPVICGQLVLFPMRRRLTEDHARRIRDRDLADYDRLRSAAIAKADRDGLSTAWWRAVCWMLRLALAVRDADGDNLVAEEILDDLPRAKSPTTALLREAGLLRPRQRSRPVVPHKPHRSCRQCDCWGFRSVCPGCNNWRRHPVGDCSRCQRTDAPLLGGHCRGLLPAPRPARPRRGEPDLDPAVARRRSGPTARDPVRDARLRRAAPEGPSTRGCRPATRSAALRAPGRPGPRRPVRRPPGLELHHHRPARPPCPRSPTTPRRCSTSSVTTPANRGGTNRSAGWRPAVSESCSRGSALTPSSTRLTSGPCPPTGLAPAPAGSFSSSPSKA